MCQVGDVRYKRIRFYTVKDSIQLFLRSNKNKYDFPLSYIYVFIETLQAVTQKLSLLPTFVRSKAILKRFV